MGSQHSPESSNKETMRAKNDIASSVVEMAMSLNLVATFSLFMNPVLLRFLEAIGQYFLFPLEMALTLFQTLLSWRKAYLSNREDKSRTIVTAIVDTCNATVMAIVFICSFAAATIFAGQLSTFILIGSVAAKTIFDAGSCLYCLGKYNAAKTPEDKAANRELAIEAGIKAAAGVVATGVVVGVLIFGIVAVAVVGIIFSVALFSSAIYACHKAYKEYKSSQNKYEAATEPGLLDRLLMYKDLGVKTADQPKPIQSVNAEVNTADIASVNEAPVTINHTTERSPKL